MAQNKDKNRKTEAQEIYDEADNAGRFAGNDADAKSAKNQAIENIRQQSDANSNKRGEGPEHTDAEARRDPAQSHDYKGEAQNVNDDTGRTLTEEEIEPARNKATEGIRQGRDIRRRDDSIY